MEWDIWSLKSVTKYEGFTEDAPAVQWFWELVSDLTEREARQLLAFVTGSDRVPVQVVGFVRRDFTTVVYRALRQCHLLYKMAVMIQTGFQQVTLASTYCSYHNTGWD